MTTQLVELERPEQLNRFARKRSTGSNVASFYIRLVNQSSDPRGVWTEVRQGLTRYSASCPLAASRSLSPQQMIEVANESEVATTYNVGDRLGKDRRVISRCRVIVGDVLAFILQKRGFISELPSAIDQTRFNSLDMLYQESDAIAVALGKPEVVQQLRSMPDLKSLLESFRRYSTIEPFLTENHVPYDRRSLARHNYRLRDYLFSNKPFAISPLLRRATFSRWIYGNQSWYETDEFNVEEVINRSAKFVYSTKAPKKINNRVCDIKAFLKRALIQEFEASRGDNQFYHQYSLEEMFTPVRECNIDELDDIDIAKTFGSFADVSYCPELFKSLVKKYIDTFDYLTIDGLAFSIFGDLDCKRDRREHLLERGLIFLENSMRLKPDTVPSLEDLTITGKERLRNFRPMFQKALPEDYTRLQRS